VRLAPTPPATLSPREVARALGVGESTVKRWIDTGRLPAVRTPGGHRRVAVERAHRLARDAHRALAEPRVLGLDALAAGPAFDAVAFEDRLHDLLTEGRGPEVERLVLSALTARCIGVAELFDGPLRGAMARIGERWQGGVEGVFVEHRASQIALSVLDRVDDLFEPATDCVAVGGSAAGDPSTIATRTAATVLASEGIAPVNLGADVPAGALLDAARRTGARLCWVSVSYVDDPPRQREALAGLVAEACDRGLACIVGGRAVDRLDLADVVAGHRGARLGRSMADLAALARELLAAPAR